MAVTPATRAVEDGSALAFEEFYVRYHPRLFGFAVRVYGRADADDIAQDAMVRAYASYARLDTARDPWPWLVAIVRNVVRDRRARFVPPPAPGGTAALPDATAEVEERHVVRAALRRLSPSDRAVLVLRECQELTFDELAGRFGRTPNALRQQVFRARRRLADAYDALGGRALGLAAALARRRPRANPDVAVAAVTNVAAFGVAAAMLAGAGTPGAAARPTAPAPVRTRHGAGPAALGEAPHGPAVQGAARATVARAAASPRATADRAALTEPAITTRVERRPLDTGHEETVGATAPVDVRARRESESRYDRGVLCTLVAATCTADGAVVRLG